MEAMGKYDFVASSPTELSFKKGDILKILSCNDAWYMAEMQGREGFVPQNYLDIQTPGWFQENSSRSSAEEDLMNKAVGHFLIRGCQSSPGDFSISVRHEHDVQHFKVIKDNMGHYFLWSEKFSSFNRLVDFYKTTSISKQRLIFLKDGSEDSQAPGAGPQNVGVVAAPEPTNQVETAGRRSPLASGAGPAAGPQRAAPKQMRAASVQVRGGPSPVRGLLSPVRGAPTQERGAPTQERGAPTQVRGAPTQERGAPTQVRGASVQVRMASVQVRALYSFQVEEEDELGFCAGDVIEVLDCTDTSWWTGRLRGRCGLFPANYTTPL